LQQQQTPVVSRWFKIVWTSKLNFDDVLCLNLTSKSCFMLAMFSLIVWPFDLFETLMKLENQVKAFKMFVASSENLPKFKYSIAQPRNTQLHIYMYDGCTYVYTYVFKWLQLPASSACTLYCYHNHPPRLPPPPSLYYSGSHASTYEYKKQQNDG